MHQPSRAEHRGPTVGSAFHEKLIKRSEIAGFMGISHTERIALNHNNECSNKSSERILVRMERKELHDNDYHYYQHYKRSLSACVFQTAFNISIYLILIVFIVKWNFFFIAPWW